MPDYLQPKRSFMKNVGRYNYVLTLPLRPSDCTSAAAFFQNVGTQQLKHAELKAIMRDQCLGTCSGLNVSLNLFDSRWTKSDTRYV